VLAFNPSYVHWTRLGLAMNARSYAETRTECHALELLKEGPKIWQSTKQIDETNFQQKFILQHHASTSNRLDKGKMVFALYL
jgi:hypothetical protein